MSHHRAAILFGLIFFERIKFASSNRDVDNAAIDEVGGGWHSNKRKEHKIDLWQQAEKKSATAIVIGASGQNENEIDVHQRAEKEMAELMTQSMDTKHKADANLKMNTHNILLDVSSNAHMNGEKTNKCDKSTIFKAIAGDDSEIEEKEWNAVFKEADANSDGSLSSQEFQDYFNSEAKKLGCDQAGVQFLFDKLDTDGNKSIEKKEWDEAWKKLQEADKAGNGNGKIDEKEWNAFFEGGDKGGTPHAVLSLFPVFVSLACLCCWLV